MREVIAAGADGVAVISAVVGSRDIIATARELRKRISETGRTEIVTGEDNPRFVLHEYFTHHHHFDFRFRKEGELKNGAKSQSAKKSLP